MHDRLLAMAALVAGALWALVALLVCCGWLVYVFTSRDLLAVLVTASGACLAPAAAAMQARADFNKIVSDAP